MSPLGFTPFAAKMRLLASILLLLNVRCYVYPLQHLLPARHPCNDLSYRMDVDIESVQGTWYVLAIICSSWNRIPFCDRVELFGNKSLLHETWSSLDLMEDPRYRNIAVYSTDLDVIQPGLWRDVRPDRAHPITLVLDAGEMLVLAMCYQGDYATPYHQHEVFILGRNLKRNLLEPALQRLSSRGVDIKQAQIVSWSMCPRL